MKRTPLLVILLFLLPVAGCASAQKVFDPPRKVSGRILVVGNEPFTRVAVRVSDSKLYLISCIHKIEQILLSHQGKFLQLTFDRMRKVQRGEEIHVIEVRILSR